MDKGKTILLSFFHPINPKNLINPSSDKHSTLQVYHKYNDVTINFLWRMYVYKLYQKRTVAVIVTNTFVQIFLLKICKSASKHSGILLLYILLISH